MINLNRTTSSRRHRRNIPRRIDARSGKSASPLFIPRSGTLRQDLSQSVSYDVQIREDERRRVARDLHDEAGHLILAAILKLDEAIRACDDVASFRRELAPVRSLLEECARGVQNAAFNLSPRILADLGLVPALRAMAQRAQEASRISVQVRAEPEHVRLELDLALLAFRIAQEALSNSIKHSGASCVAIEVKQTSGQILIEVADDGAGFDPASIESSSHARLGLRGMHERASLVGGTLEITSGPAIGTRIRASLPAQEVSR